MRNLKRALSLALASIMLLGMMVVGTSAASTSGFPDAGKISNQEAVDLTTGLGIFKGYEDGNFKPENIVTRAEMAVMICKILHGADVDPANYVGAGKFTDVPKWAEGWVNMCSALHIIEGKGNGIFDPNGAVTTVEASTMLLKALGYYTTEKDSLDADWKLEVTSKATALGLYGDLTLDMNKGLTRDNAAEMLYNTIFAQMVAFNDYRGQYVKNTDRDVVVTAGTKDAKNTLAYNTFGLYMAEGVVVANGMTDKALSESTKSKAMTTVLFNEKVDLDQDGKFEIAAGETYDFEVETGLNMIGHAANVYYKVEKKAPVVFAITDQATKVAFITYDKNTAILADAANDLGFKKDSVLKFAPADYLVNYDLGVKYSTVSAFDLDTLLVISNHGNYDVDYVIALDQNLNKVGSVDEYRGETTYSVKYGTDGKDMNVATKDFKENDYVITTDIGCKGDVLVLEPATVLSADITKITGKSTANSDVKMVTASGVDYKKSEVANKVTDNFEEFTKIATIGEANLVLDQFGKLIGLAGEKSVPNYAYVAQFGIRHSSDSLSTKNVWAAEVYFADGTSGVYEIDTKESTLYNTTSLLGSKDYDTVDEVNGEVAKNSQDPGTATKGYTNLGLQANAGLKGVYDVKILSNGKVAIDVLTTDVSKAATPDQVRLATAHSTLLSTNDPYSFNGNAAMNTTKDNDSDSVIYQNNDTVYFYVTGSYAGDNLKVSVITGVKNAVKFTNSANDNDTTIDTKTGTLKGTGIRQAFADVKTNAKDIITTMLVQGVEVENETLYYYDQGSYVVVRASDNKGFTLTYNLYNAKTGEAKAVTYDNDGKFFDTVEAAKTHAEKKADGFYKIGSRNLIAYTTANKLDNIGKGDAYVVNDTASYDEIVDNLFTASVPVASIIGENTKIVDICDSGLTTVKKIANALKGNKDGTHSDVTLSYIFDKNYNAYTVFVTDYKPDAVKPVVPPVGPTTGYDKNAANAGLILNGQSTLSDLTIGYVAAKETEEEALMRYLDDNKLTFVSLKNSGELTYKDAAGREWTKDLTMEALFEVKEGNTVVAYANANVGFNMTQAANQKGGTGYVMDGAYKAYDELKPTADKTIDRGYVEVNNTAKNITGKNVTSNGGTVTIEKTEADVSYVKVGGTVTYTVTYKVETADAGKDIKVTFAAVTGADGTVAPHTIAKADAAVGTDKTFEITVTAKGDQKVGQLDIANVEEVSVP